VWATVAVVGALVLVVAGLVLGDRLAARGKVAHNVEVAGVHLGGTTDTVAARRIAPLVARLRTGPISVVVRGTRLSIDPSAIGLTVDERATVRAARRVGHDGGFCAQLVDSLARRVRPERLPLVVHVDERRLAGVLDGWGVQAAGGLDPGSLVFHGVDVRVSPPKAGHGLRRAGARAALLDALRHGRVSDIALPVGRVEPPATPAEYERAAAHARRVLAAPVTIVLDGHPFTLTPPQLATTLTTHLRGRHVDLAVDGPKLRAALGPPLAALEQPPVDASFSVNGTHVSVVPSKPGRILATGPAGDAILRGERTVTATVTDVQPARVTAWAQRLDITELVSTFTTHHPAGEPRVRNIHRAADILDNTVVEPGQVFSMNATIGPRTPERGFVKAPIVLEDSFGEDYGGGVSQLATTTYNAIFFGGYKDVTHAAHLVYIDRYPLGREATVNYGAIDLKFQNDSHSGILIRTSYSSTSITVSFYGNKEGRSVRAEGPDILKTTPVTTEYVDDPTLPPGRTQVIQQGHMGYDVVVYRIISRPGQPDVRERYYTHYDMFPTKIARGVPPGTPTTSTTTTTTAAPVTAPG
jgi:vancomycin resistance protein YoaR